METIAQYYDPDSGISILQNLDGINQPFTCEQWADFGGIESYNIVNDGPLYTLYDLFSTDGSWHSIAVFDQNMVLRYYGFQEPLDLIDDVIENLLSETNYIFSENIRITESSNDQKFPEIAIDDNMIHLTWVGITGSNKNIMHSKSEDYGETFSASIQINYVNNNIVAEISSAIRKNMEDVAIVRGTKGSISLSNPWTPGKEGGPFKSSIIPLAGSSSNREFVH